MFPASCYADFMDNAERADREAFLVPLLRGVIPGWTSSVVNNRDLTWWVERIAKAIEGHEPGDPLPNPDMAPLALVAHLRRTLAEQSRELDERMTSQVPTLVERTLNEPLRTILHETVQAEVVKLDDKLRRSRFMGRFDIAFSVLLLLAVGLVSLLVYWSWLAIPTATIEFNVGELIGGILGGGGIAVAGTAYAVKTLSETSSRQG